MESTNIMTSIKKTALASLCALALASTANVAPASATLLSTSTMSLTINGTNYQPISSIDGINSSPGGWGGAIAVPPTNTPLS